VIYNRLKLKTEELLEKYGTDGEIVFYDSDNIQMSRGKVKAIRIALNVDVIPSSIVEDVDSTILCDSNIGINKDDYIIFDSTLYKIIDFELIRPTDTSIVYQLFVGV